MYSKIVRKTIITFSSLGGGSHLFLIGVHPSSGFGSLSGPGT